MKLYKDTHDIFVFALIILVIFYVISFFVCPIMRDLIIGLIGSSIVIIIQSKIGYKNETNRIIYPFLKEIYDESFNFCSYSLYCDYETQDEYLNSVRNGFKKIKKNIIFLSKIDTLNKEQMSKITGLKNIIYKLEEQLYYIFETYDNANVDQKICLYLELHEIMCNYNEEELFDLIFDTCKSFSIRMVERICDFDTEDEERLNNIKTKTTNDIYIYNLEKKYKEECVLIKQKNM